MVWRAPQMIPVYNQGLGPLLSSRLCHFLLHQKMWGCKAQICHKLFYTHSVALPSSLRARGKRHPLYMLPTIFQDLLLSLISSFLLGLSLQRISKFKSPLCLIRALHLFIPLSPASHPSTLHSVLHILLISPWKPSFLSRTSSYQPSLVGLSHFPLSMKGCQIQRLNPDFSASI